MIQFIWSEEKCAQFFKRKAKELAKGDGPKGAGVDEVDMFA